jgi:sugar (pentulose or hexulose) kinase
LKCYIGLDLGTSGCRGIAIDEQSEVVSETALPLPEPESPRPGEHQQAPDLWWQAVVEILRRLVQACDHYQVEGIAVDGTSSTLLLCDETGWPLTPGLMYNDKRSLQAVEKLRQFAPADSPVLTATSSLAKLLHLLPEVSTRPVYALHQADWIMGRLCGGFPISDENNSLKMGYDPVERCWPRWLEALKLPQGCLPKVFPSASPVGAIDQALAEETGLATTTTVISGTTDSNAAFLATGANQIGDAVTSLGSTLVLKILSDRPVYDSGRGVYSHRLGDRWLVGGASNSGGAVCRHFFTDEQMLEMSANLNPAKRSGLDYYPLLTPGERFPINDPDFPPRLSPKPADDSLFFQGILEGLTDIEAAGYRLLHELGAPMPKRIISIGGGAINEPWRMMRERAVGVPVICARQQAAAYGTALLAKAGVAGS